MRAREFYERQYHAIDEFRHVSLYRRQIICAEKHDAAGFTIDVI